MPRLQQRNASPKKSSETKKVYGNSSTDSSAGLLNLYEVSEDFVNKLNKRGFNGVSINAYTENETDPARLDGQPQEIIDECNHHYAIFVIEPEFDEDISDNPYVSKQLHYDRFWQDMKKEMVKTFGVDVEIKCVGYNGQEWEVTRKPQYALAWAKYEKWWESK